MQDVPLLKELKDPLQSGPRSKAPIFVLGCPRSGTTLLYHMLLSAGNFVVYRAESQVFNLLEPRFGDLRVPRNRSKLLDAWRGSPLFAKTGLDAHELDAEVLTKCTNGGDFLRIMMEAMARHQGVERWADCTPDHLLYLDRIKETIPSALVLHVIRDGRDVALSMAGQGWIRPIPYANSGNLEAAALYWDWIVNKGRKSRKRFGSNYMEIRFENLISNPNTTLAKVGHFIEQELDYDRIRRVGIGSVSQPNSSFESELRTGNFSPVARWKTVLSSDELGKLETLVGETLEQLGYGLALGAKRRNRAFTRSLYHGYFGAKLFLKQRTPLGALFTTRDLSWV